MTLDVPALTTLLDGKYADLRQLVRENLAEHASILDDAEQMSTEQFRERVLEVVQLMASTGQTGHGFPKEYGGSGDVGASVAAFETLALGDLSVVVKVGVQFGLFGGAILQLGTKPHHDAYLEDLIEARLLGCFAMTETGHGSNVQALATTATYDVQSGEFVVDTPDDRARKDYIGNARTTRATRWCSPSWSSVVSRAGCTRSSYASVTRTGTRRPACGSRTAAARSGSTAWTTAGSGSTGCGCRGRTCWTATPW